MKVFKDNLSVAKQMMENYPEYSLDPLYCIKYDYTKGVYIFKDTEESKCYTVSIKDVADILPEFMSRLNKSLFFYGFNEDNLKKMKTDNDFLCSIDSYFLNAVVQFAIFKDVIYG